MVSFQTITREEYKANPPKFKIIYGLHTTPFGKCLIGITSTDKAIIHLGFVDNALSTELTVLKNDWPLTEVAEDSNNETEKIISRVFSEDAFEDDSLSVLLKGTEFQTTVWKSLISIPPGTTTTYEKVAQSIDKPKAIRAVANAIMNNKVAYLVPCHRVMGKSGSNKYAWGVERKQNILTHENKSN